MGLAVRAWSRDSTIEVRDHLSAVCAPDKTAKIDSAYSHGHAFIGEPDAVESSGEHTRMVSGHLDRIIAIRRRAPPSQAPDPAAT